MGCVRGCVRVRPPPGFDPELSYPPLSTQPLLPSLLSSHLYYATSCSREIAQATCAWEARAAQGRHGAATTLTSRVEADSKRGARGGACAALRTRDTQAERAAAAGRARYTHSCPKHPRFIAGARQPSAWCDANKAQEDVRAGLRAGDAQGGVARTRYARSLMPPQFCTLELRGSKPTKAHNGAQYLVRGAPHLDYGYLYTLLAMPEIKKASALGGYAYLPPFEDLVARATTGTYRAHFALEQEAPWDEVATMLSAQP